MTIQVPSSIRVLMPNGHVVEMKLETYLAGVVASEMGANAPLEALKAQAVAARTYAASAHRHSEANADVCTKSHCQEWRRVDPIVAPEVFRALSETWGIVAIHEGKLIEAFFHEHCDGHTRSSEDLMMPAIPYLRGVECGCGFAALKGHGVGLCQRGAIVMARRDASFEEILRHYYRGVVIVHSGDKVPDAPHATAPAPRRTVPPVAPKPTPAAHLKPAGERAPREDEAKRSPTPPSAKAPSQSAEPLGIKRTLRAAPGGPGKATPAPRSTPPVSQDRTPPAHSRMRPPAEKSVPQAPPARGLGDKEQPSHSPPRAMPPIKPAPSQAPTAGAAHPPPKSQIRRPLPATAVSTRRGDEQAVPARPDPRALESNPDVSVPAKPAPRVHARPNSHSAGSPEPGLHSESEPRQEPAALEQPVVFDVPLPPPPVIVDAARTETADSQASEVEAHHDRTTEAQPAVEERTSEVADDAEAETEAHHDRATQAQPAVEDRMSEVAEDAEAETEAHHDWATQAQPAVEERASEVAEDAEAETEAHHDRAAQAEPAVEEHVSEAAEDVGPAQRTLDEPGAVIRERETISPAESGARPAVVAASAAGEAVAAAQVAEARDAGGKLGDEEKHGESAVPNAASPAEPARDVTEPVASEPPLPADTLRIRSEWEREQSPPSAQAPVQDDVPATTVPDVPSIPVPDYVAQLNNPARLLPPDEPAADAVVPSIPVEDLPALDEEISVRKSRVHVDHLPGMRMIAGCLPRPGMLIAIEDQHGRKRILFSGSAPHYGPGGFETAVTEDGRYVVAIDRERVVVDVEGDTVFLSWCE